jgi:hypothetical protein
VCCSSTNKTSSSHQNVSCSHHDENNRTYDIIYSFVNQAVNTYRTSPFICYDAYKTLGFICYCRFHNLFPLLRFVPGDVFRVQQCTDQNQMVREGIQKYIDEHNATLNEDDVRDFMVFIDSGKVPTY